MGVLLHDMEAEMSELEVGRAVVAARVQYAQVSIVESTWKVTKEGFEKTFFANYPPLGKDMPVEDFEAQRAA